MKNVSAIISSDVSVSYAEMFEISEDSLNDFYTTLSREYFSLRKKAKKMGLKTKNIKIYMNSDVAKSLYLDKRQCVYLQGKKRTRAVDVEIDDSIHSKRVYPMLPLSESNIYIFSKDWFQK